MILHGEFSGEVGTLTEANISEGYGIVQLRTEKMKVPFSFMSRYDNETV
jgi:hypothetical protein